MDFVKIGKIIGVHGLDGKLILQYEWNQFPFQQLRHIFIELKRESYIPYFIEAQKKINDGQVWVRLDEVDSVDDAKALSGKNIFTEKQQYAIFNPKGMGGDLTGFVLEDKSRGRIGVIQSVFEAPGQVIASVLYRNKEALVPLAEHIIIRIDRSAKIIKADLPEGLLDIYL